MKIKTENGEVEYMPVHERIKLLKDGKVDYSLGTSYEYSREERRFVVLATLTLYKPSGERHYSGHASEVIGEGSSANEFSALENAETSAVGRALAFAGYGIDAGIASAEEMKRTLTPEQVVEKLSAHLKSLTTREAVDKAAEEFKVKYSGIYAQRNVQNMFKKRIGEIIINAGKAT